MQAPEQIGRLRRGDVLDEGRQASAVEAMVDLGNPGSGGEAAVLLGGIAAEGADVVEASPFQG